jgi:hypothetical protein
MDENNIQIQIQRIIEAKEQIRQFLNENGASVSKDVLLSEYPNILAGLNLSDTSNTTALSSDILFGKTAVSNGKKIIGTIPVKSGERIIPGRLNVVIEAGNYISGDIVIEGEQMLLPWNIKKGVTLFGVEGNGEFSEGGEGGEEVELGVLVEDENGEIKYQKLLFNGTEAEVYGELQDISENVSIYNTGIEEPIYEQQLLKLDAY